MGGLVDAVEVEGAALGHGEEGAEGAAGDGEWEWAVGVVGHVGETGELLVGALNFVFAEDVGFASRVEE